MASALIISFVEWAGAFQRPQHMAVGLARRGWEVTYASPGYIHRRGERIDHKLDWPETLHVIEPPALPGAGRAAAIAALNRTLMLHWLRRAARGRWDLIVFNNPHWANVAGELTAARRVFDCMDDLSAATNRSPQAHEAAERDALEVADRVWTGTASLADRLADRHDHVTFVPCGVDAHHFGGASREARERARAELPAGDGPVAGYFGAINERFDAERLAAFMEAAPWRVELIGPTTSRAPQLPRSPNLVHLGPRPYAELPAHLLNWDVALIPYDLIGPHRFLYPVKALEYLAGAVPVLSTPLPDVVRFLRDYVELADTPEHWAEAGRNLFDDRTIALEKARDGQQFARSRSWGRMVDEMEQDLESDT